MIYFNLLPHREATRALQRDQFNKSMLLAAILAGITAFAIYGAISTSLDAQRQNQATLEQEIKRFEKQIIEIKDLESQIASLLARQKAVEDIQSDRNSPVRLLSELGKNTPQGVAITKLSQKDQDITLEGIAKSNETLSEFLDNLGKADGWFSKPELVVSTAESPAGAGKAQKSTYKFTVKAVLMRSAQSASPASPASAARLAPRLANKG
jgi:type IV pilus assembly protein PilN